MLVAAGVSHADDPPKPQAALTESETKLLEQLGDADEAVRQTATRQLMRNVELEVETFKRLYDAATLPEQQQRILKAARHQAIRQLITRMLPGNQPSPGSVGVNHRRVDLANFELEQLVDKYPRLEEFIGRPGIHVMDTLAGFPGYVELLPDDIIVAVDGKPLPPDMDRIRFGESIQTRQAGEHIIFTVLRRNTLIDVDIELASVHALRLVYQRSSAAPSMEYENFWLMWREIILGHMTSGSNSASGNQPEKNAAE